MQEVVKQEIIYKKQGDGRDSWGIKEFDSDGNLINAYMVYEDPSVEKKISLENIDLTTLTAEQLRTLKEALNSV